MRLIYTPEAIRDIRQISVYIRDNLRSPNAANRISGVILDHCGQLKDFPLLGVSVQEKTGYETDLRMLICEHYLAFYQVRDDCVMVARILDGRQDYIKLLFGQK